MRVVIQRVTSAHVAIEGQIVGAIANGLLVFVGVTQTDNQTDADYLADKVIHLRIFQDADQRMNRSIMETGGAILVVSQFTLYGDCRKGRRPSFDEAAPASQAKGLYYYFVERLRASNTNVQTGVFQAEMAVHLVNDGPVTLVVDSVKNK